MIVRECTFPEKKPHSRLLSCANLATKSFYGKDIHQGIVSNYAKYSEQYWIRTRIRQRKYLLNKRINKEKELQEQLQQEQKDLEMKKELEIRKELEEKEKEKKRLELEQRTIYEQRLKELDKKTSIKPATLEKKRTTEVIPKTVTVVTPCYGLSSCYQNTKKN
jgi:hypothetical protein